MTNDIYVHAKAWKAKLNHFAVRLSEKHSTGDAWALSRERVEKHAARHTEAEHKYLYEVCQAFGARFAD